MTDTTDTRVWENPGTSWWPVPSKWGSDFMQTRETSEGGFSPRGVCYLAFLIAPPVSQGKDPSCSIDHLLVGNRLMLGP